MAKTGEFKNKLTKAQEDLFKSLDSEKVKRNQTSTKFVQELNKQGKANVKTLNSLNKEYLEHVQKNDTNLQTFIDKVNSINEELQLGINTYNENYDVDKELEKLMDQKDKVVAPLKTRFKREIHDINIKIDRIDKELKETLEDRNKTSENELEDYKNKLIDFEKRKRFDQNRIQNNTIKAYDELQKRLLKENKRSEIKKINKEIKEIRYQGLIEEKESLFDYFNEQKKYELDYAKHEFDVELENYRLENEYNIRIENTKFDRSIIEFNFQKEFDRYDNEVVHNLNAVNKEMEYKQNAMKEVFYKNIYESTIEKLNNETKKNDDELKVVNNIYEHINNYDLKQINTYVELNRKDLNSIDNDLKLFNKNINLTLNFYLQNIISLYHTYFKDLFHKEENFINTLIINEVNGEFLNGYSYQEYVSKVNELFNKFKEAEEQAISSYEEILNNLLNNLLTQVEVFITGINELNNKIHETVVKYHTDMTEILNSAKDNGILFYNNLHTEKVNNIEKEETDNKNLFDSRNETLANEKVSFDQEYLDREAKVKVVEDEQSAKYHEMHDGYVKVRDEAINELNTLYQNQIEKAKLEYEDKIMHIEEKFANEFVVTEKDYKVKMGLL